MIKQALKARLALRLGDLAVLALLLAAPAFGQNWVEERTYFSSGVATPRIDGLLTRPVKGNLGSFVWFQMQQGYGQAYAGATYNPKPWVQFALGGGLEEDKHPARIGSYVWVGKGRVSGLAVFEDGGSGFWYKVETNCQVTARLGLGTLTEAAKGTGPKLELALPHTRLKLWFAPLWRSGSLMPLVGFRWLL
ncbi:MAG: hypothetical protein M1400_01730 [Patescibacteria group bacterium]|nr:hypothetical protein [Patescibacteria group bacterium]